MTPTEVYNLARGAGFPPDTARKMVAIAQRESSLNPGVIGTINAAKETSYGLWQINLKDAGIARLMAANGITADNIRIPAVNAQAAYLLWGGRDANLDTSWYINRYGNQYGYAEKYQQNLSRLPAAGELEAVYSGSGDGGLGPATPYGPGPTITYQTANGFDYSPTSTTAPEYATGDGNGGGSGIIPAAPGDAPYPDDQPSTELAIVNPQTLILMAAAGLIIWWWFQRD